MTTQWLAEQIEAGHVGGPDGIALLESDEDVLLYATGHIPGALKIDWHVDLNDPVSRDYVDGAGFARVMGERGIRRDTTVVIYGDKSNWWAAYALWVFSLFGHDDVRLLDGGRAKWIAEGREVTRDVPTPTAVRLPRRRARRRADPRVQGRRARPPRQAARRRALPGRVLRRAAPHARLPPGGRDARRPHPRREVGPVGSGRPGGRVVQVARGPRGDLPRRAGPRARPTTSWPTAASGSAPPTRGSCSPTCSASSRCATTTARGPSGATPCACRSRGECDDQPRTGRTTPPAELARRDRRRLPLCEQRPQARAAPRVQ